MQTAMFSNELEVRLEGRLVKYADFEEMRKKYLFFSGLLAQETRAQRLTYRPNLTTQRDC